MHLLICCYALPCGANGGQRKKRKTKQANAYWEIFIFPFLPLPTGSHQIPDVFHFFNLLSYILLSPHILFLLHQLLPLNLSLQISHLPSSLVPSSPVFLNLCSPLSLASCLLPVSPSDLSCSIQLALSSFISPFVLL